jgi:pantoate--beta-alanine ligase
MSLVDKGSAQRLPVIETIQQARKIISSWRQAGETIVLVPTMGNLHDGHLALVKAAKELGTKIVVSIFVNPMQFGKNDDFDEYPRTLEEDVSKLHEFNVDFVFTPSLNEIYPGGEPSLSLVDVQHLSGVLEGEYRPGFFQGVATVVNKLFNIIQPDIAVFGEKDFQQLLVIEQMVNDLILPIEIKSVATVREMDGLAMSSRNSYLDDEQRRLASGIHECLERVAQAVRKGGDPNFEVGHATHDLLEQGFIVDYVVVRRQQDLAVPEPDDKALIALVAARLGSVRLIDNILFELPT